MGCLRTEIRYYRYALVVSLFGLWGGAAFADTNGAPADLQKEFSLLRAEVKSLEQRLSATASYEGSFLDVSSICHGRLTLTTGTPVTSSNVSAASTLYFTPYKGSNVSIFNGSKWIAYSFTERSLSLSSLTSGANYDVFIYNNSGTLTLELSAAWNSDTTRFSSGTYATALPTQDGIPVKSTNGTTVDNTRRYLGTIRTTGTTTTEDSATKRFVWNYCNRIRRHVQVLDSTANWAPTSAAWESANNSTNNRIQIVTGDAVEPVYFLAISSFANGTATSFIIAVGIGEDTTTASSGISPKQNSWIDNGTWANTFGFLLKVPTLGYHYYQWVSYVSSTSNSPSWQSSSIYSGLSGFTWN